MSRLIFTFIVKNIHYGLSYKKILFLLFGFIVMPPDFLNCQTFSLPIRTQTFFWEKQTFNATFFCCYFLTEKTFLAGLIMDSGLFLSLCLYRQEKAYIINYWHIMALSFCCYFFLCFSLVDTEEGHSDEGRGSVLCCTLRSRLRLFHFGFTLQRLVKSGERFSSTGLFKTCFQWREFWYIC